MTEKICKDCKNFIKPDINGFAVCEKVHRVMEFDCKCADPLHFDRILELPEYND